MTAYVRYTTWWGGTRVAKAAGPNETTIDLTLGWPRSRRLAKRIARRLAQP